jgi:hypothetical protein
MVPTMNGGYVDRPEDERECLDLADRRCGPMMLRVESLCRQSMARIARTADKWKAMTA